MRPTVTPAEAESRLRFIFPRTAFDTVLSSPLAAWAAATLIYVDAVSGPESEPTDVHWARPSTVMWMSPQVLTRSNHSDRAAWRTAAGKSRRTLEALHRQWREPFTPQYMENSRETLRDETFRKWLEHGAMRRRAGLHTSSNHPRWALLDDFAALFDPALTDSDFRAAAAHWRDTHMDPGSKLKAAFAAKQETANHAVTVTLPDGSRRTLEPGTSSLILQGVVESWATIRLGRPVVLTISEPGDKVHLGDGEILRALGIKLDVGNVLPDAVIADIQTDPVIFWIVEAVATDGPVTDARRAHLLDWAERQNIKPEQCRFLTAFASRNSPIARRRLKDVASDTWAWFADEPDHELAWYRIAQKVARRVDG